MLKKRDPAVALLLSFVTCGIYTIYWFISITDEVKFVTQSKKLNSGGMSFLLSLITCGIYSFIWAYNMGKALFEHDQAKGKAGEDRSVLFVISQVVGLSIVTYFLVQQSLNEEIDALQQQPVTN